MFPKHPGDLCNHSNILTLQTENTGLTGDLMIPNPLVVPKPAWTRTRCQTQISILLQSKMTRNNWKNGWGTFYFYGCEHSFNKRSVSPLSNAAALPLHIFSKYNRAERHGSFKFWELHIVMFGRRFLLQFLGANNKRRTESQTSSKLDFSQIQWVCAFEVIGIAPPSFAIKYVTNTWIQVLYPLEMLTKNRGAWELMLGQHKLTQPELYNFLLLL